MTYEVLFPYLKGFHLTLASFLDTRGEDGWALADDVWNAYLENQLHDDSISGTQLDQLKNRSVYGAPPDSIKPAPLFIKCLGTLKKFFKSAQPPIVMDRTNIYTVILYGFGDASKSGFGSMLDDGNNIQYRIGTWGIDSEDASSNWREFENLVTTIEEEAAKGTLTGSFLIMATDNSTAEAFIL